jgi:hypothetical protein
MFFSTASWKSGGGGRSTARNKKGDTDVLMSVAMGQSLIALDQLGTDTSINIKTRFLFLFSVWPYEDLLSFHTDFPLKGLKDRAWIRYQR